MLMDFHSLEMPMYCVAASDYPILLDSSVKFWPYPSQCDESYACVGPIYNDHYWNSYTNFHMNTCMVYTRYAFVRVPPMYWAQQNVYHNFHIYKHMDAHQYGVSYEFSMLNFVWWHRNRTNICMDDRQYLKW